MGFNVIHYTLELGEDYVGRRYDAYFTHIPVNKILENQTASGYIVNNKYYDKLINLYEYAMPLLAQTRSHWIYANDQIWKKLQEKDNWYYFIKRIGKQQDGYSDNTERFEKYNC